MQVFGGGSSYTPPNKAFFTVDDGASYFPDSFDRVPPYDSNGKVAVLAHVYRCEAGKSKVVGYLERVTADGKKRRQELIDKKSPAGFEELELTGKEVKAPKVGDWVKKSDPRALDIMSPKCPGAKAQDFPTEVFP